MNCNEFKNAIWDYIEGKSSEEMASHVSECAECRIEAQRCRALLESIGKLAEAEFPADLHERIMQRVREEGAPQKSANNKRRFIRIASGIAAALVITFIGVLASQNGLISGNSSNSAQEPMLAVADTRTLPESEKAATAEGADMLEGQGAQVTDTPYSSGTAPTMGAMASGSTTSNVLNAQPTDRERVEAYLTTNAIQFDEADNEIYAYAYGEAFDKLEAFLVNELGMEMPENTDENYQTTIIFE